MKKGLSLFFAMTLALSVSVTPVAAKPGNGKSEGSSSQKEETKGSGASEGSSSQKEETKGSGASGDSSSQKEETKGSGTSGTSVDDIQKENDSSKASNEKIESKSQSNKKEFKDELNEQKKELQQEKRTLNQQLEGLQLQYENLIAAGDEKGAASLLENINGLKEQIQGVQSQIKETINERYMLVKTMYTDEELAEFSNVKDLISQMYADAEVLSAGSVTINNNLIKFDTPAYIKNGVTLVPLRAISEELGGEVSWDEETQTVTITNGDTVVQITANSTTGMVNGEAIEISVPATETCGRTYVPLRFLAESLGLTTEWDSENDLIEISDGTEAPVEEVSGVDVTGTIGEGTTAVE